MRIVLVHGFNVFDNGAGSIDKLRPYLEEAGHEVDTDSADYGWHGLLQVRVPWLRKGLIGRLRSAFHDADVIITHSNGANYATQALGTMAYYDHDQETMTLPRDKVVIHISPALNQKAKIPACIKTMWVMHTQRDLWVKLGQLLIGHMWGAMGAYGYHGPDKRGRSIDCTRFIPQHSEWFKDELIGLTGNWVTRLINEKTTGTDIVWVDS